MLISSGEHLELRSTITKSKKDFVIFFIASCTGVRDYIMFEEHSGDLYQEKSSKTHNSNKISEVETYKLTYFNYRGRAEVIRLLFAQANVSYEDVRISRKEWPALKSKTPFGHVPILEVNGKVLAESHAIEKYLARKFGLLGADEWEAAKIDEIVMNLEDLRRKILLSLADLAVFDILQLFDAKSTKELEKYPKLNDFTMRIEEMPKIKAWIEKRPKTSF
uniref:Glutathione S-transferase 1 n=1 Tax=Setaria digitata TaxID=48799 RepID=A0A915PCD4_9BILA